MISAESLEMQIGDLKIESLSYALYQKLINYSDLLQVDRVLAIPTRVRTIGVVDGIAYAYIDNMESSIRACLTDKLGNILGVCVLYDIDFTMGECSIYYKSILSQERDIMDLFVYSISEWARDNACLIIQNYDALPLKNDLKHYIIPVKMPNYCIDRISSEIEKKSVIDYFDKYMFSPLSKNMDRENIYSRMIAASEILLAYNKSLMGFISFYANNTQNRTAFISSIAVSDSCRGAGVGSSLLEQCKKISIIRGMDRLELKVNKRNDKAISFYSRQGFVKKDSELENEYAMVLELK